MLIYNNRLTYNWIPINNSLLLFLYENSYIVRIIDAGGKCKKVWQLYYKTKRALQNLSLSLSLSLHTYIHKWNVVSFCLYYNSSLSSFILHVFIDVRAACYMLLHGTRTWNEVGNTMCIGMTKGGTRNGKWMFQTRITKT